MGSIKKALKPITRVVDNIIPNEIKPALPYLAATFGAPYLAPAFGSLGGTGIMGAALRKGLAGAVTNLGTQVALGKNVNPVSVGISGLLAGAGPALAGTGKFGKSVGEFISPDKISGMTLGEATAAATTPLTAGTAEAAYDAAKEADDAYEEYLKQQEAANNEDIQTRVEFITRYLQNAGFDQDYIDTRLNELGYAANGGLMGIRMGYEQGGSSTVEQQKRENYFDLKRDEFMSLSEYLLSPMSDADLRSGKAMGGRINFKGGGYDPAIGTKKQYEEYLDDLENDIISPDTTFNEWMDNNAPDPDYDYSMKDGGIMNLKMGGMPAEMDLRGGGFVPIGAKEKADDVPARLSKNEFVMTADAVRAAGGGSVNKGAKRMYDLMNKLEARV